MARGQRDLISTAFTVIDHTDTVSFSSEDGTASGAATLAAVVGTLLSELKKQGIVNATITAT